LSVTVSHLQLQLLLVSLTDLVLQWITINSSNCRYNFFKFEVNLRIRM